MAKFARRDIVATLASLVSTTLPVDLSNEGERLTGVVDRVRRDAATVLLERGDETVEERLVAVDRLPANARREGAVLRLTVDDDELRTIEYDSEATERRIEAAEERFDAVAED